MGRVTLHIGRVLLSCLLPAMPALAQLSPGELSTAHHELEGMSNCTACHTMGRAIADQNCLTCHSALSARMEAGKGLHARFSGRTCVTCHKEHHGRDFDLVRLDRRTFDHRETGYPLGGRHATISCEQCHQPSRIRAPDVRQNSSLMSSGTFLGLPSDCASCHDDPHRASLGPSCGSCHSDAAWKPSTGFDHSRTRFPLTGRHNDVPCASCHRQTAGEPTSRVFRLSRFDECTACHRDPHAGRVAGQCSTCHTTAGWRSAARTFDHTSTRFPLRGAHVRLECRQCHGEGSATRSGHRRIERFARCTDCHQDPHRGQFAERPGGAECTGCHSEAGWDVRTIAGFDHGTTRFPLRGRHAQTDCGGCHGRTANAVTAGAGRRVPLCQDCHRDPHAGQFAGQRGCEACHTDAGFLPTTYTVAAHEDSRFPLEGDHRAVACTQCHRVDASPGMPVRRFRTESLATCSACHRDVHRGTLDRWMDDGCATCHVAVGWDNVRFAHATTGFRLTGGHTSVRCVGCHGSDAGSAWTTRRTPRTCADCHDARVPLRSESGS